jgi:hypothetical protein
VKGDYLYRRQLKTGREELVSIVNNTIPVKDSATAATAREMHALSEAIYETARYLLLNNKKKK